MDVRTLRIKFKMAQLCRSINVYYHTLRSKFCPRARLVRDTGGDVAHVAVFLKLLEKHHGNTQGLRGSPLIAQENLNLHFCDVKLHILSSTAQNLQVLGKSYEKTPF